MGGDNRAAAASGRVCGRWRGEASARGGATGGEAAPEVPGMGKDVHLRRWLQVQVVQEAAADERTENL